MFSLDRSADPSRPWLTASTFSPLDAVSAAAALSQQSAPAAASAAVTDSIGCLRRPDAVFAAAALSQQSAPPAVSAPASYVIADSFRTLDTVSAAAAQSNLFALAAASARVTDTIV